MSVKLQYSLVCLGYDESKGPPSFQNVIHELPLAPFPYEFPDGAGLFLVNGWLNLPATARCTVKIEGPAGPIVDQQFELTAQPESAFQLSLVFLEGIAFPEPGDYWVSCGLDGQAFTRYPLLVLDAEE